MFHIHLFITFKHSKIKYINKGGGVQEGSMNGEDLSFDSNTPRFNITAKGRIPARVIRIHDGDTITCISSFLDRLPSGCVIEGSVRLLGIDTAEIHSKNLTLERHALKARARLIQLCCLGGEHHTNKPSLQIPTTTSFTSLTTNHQTHTKLQTDLSATLCTMTDNELETYFRKHCYIIYAEYHGTDKYGRYIADLYSSMDLSEPSFSEILIAERLAYKYLGKTKKSDDDQLAYFGLTNVPSLSSTPPDQHFDHFHPKKDIQYKKGPCLRTDSLCSSSSLISED
jgi:endonuclease YncB( thermonuclease family)